MGIITLPDIPELELEYLQGVADAFMTLDITQYTLEPFFAYPDPVRGMKWLLEFTRRVQSRGRFKAYGAPSHDIGKEIFGWAMGAPLHFGEGTTLSEEQFDTLRYPGQFTPADRNRTIAEVTAPLLRRWREARHYLMVQCLSTGQFSINDQGSEVDVDYQFASMDNPDTAWSDAGAKIYSDVLNYTMEFEELTGLPCDTVFYNPKIMQAFVNNTDVAKWVTDSKHPMQVREFLAQREFNIFNGLGFRLWDLNWVPVRHMLETVPGDKTSRAYTWPTNTLTFANLLAPSDVPILEFRRARTSETRGTGGPFIDFTESDDPPGRIRFRCWANGLPTALVEDRFVTVADVGAID